MCFNLKNIVFFIFLFTVPFNALSQTEQQNLYKNVLLEMGRSLSGDTDMSFKRAVYLTENAYFDDKLSYAEFENGIDGLCILTKSIATEMHLKYEKADSNRIKLYASVFMTLTDTIPILINNDTVYHHPFVYDFQDIFGKDDWTKMFVSKLIKHHKGNCHSLPYLYKIIVEELGAKAHLALAPNHIYVKHRAEKGGMYNTELTSATFPVDAWLMASGYITLEAIQNGIYMDTLSEKESIALCVIDLAQGFNHKYPDNDGKFVIECCDLALKYFPDYVNAMLLKAETRLKQLQQMQKRYGYTHLKEVTKQADGKAKWDEMNALYGQLLSLGYRQMPEQMYVDWLVSLKKEKEKYTNKQAPGATKN